MRREEREQTREERNDSRQQRANSQQILKGEKRAERRKETA